MTVKLRFALQLDSPALQLRVSVLVLNKTAIQIVNH